MAGGRIRAALFALFAGALPLLSGSGLRADQIDVMMHPMVDETDPVEFWEVCFKSDVELHRLTIGVEPPDPYAGTLSWVDCPTNSVCSGAPGSLYDDTYLSGDPGISFAELVNGKLFIVLGGAEPIQDGALATPANWNLTFKCLARLQLSIPTVISNPPTVVSGVDPDMASISWASSWNDYSSSCAEPIIVNGDMVGCSGSATFSTTAGEASAVPDDNDADLRANEDDNCIHKYNPDQADSGGFMTAAADGVGDLCQCGEGDGTGQIWLDDPMTSFDQTNMLEHLRGNTPVNFDEDRCNLGGDSACTIFDAALLDQGLKQNNSVANDCQAFTN